MFLNKQVFAVHIFVKLKKLLSAISCRLRSFLHHCDLYFNSIAIINPNLIHWSLIQNQLKLKFETAFPYQLTRQCNIRHFHLKTFMIRRYASCTLRFIGHFSTNQFSRNIFASKRFFYTSFTLLFMYIHKG